jgi:hypothetical protein
MRNSNRTSAGKRTPRRIKKYNIRMDLKEILYEDMN